MAYIFFFLQPSPKCVLLESYRHFPAGFLDVGDGTEVLYQLYHTDVLTHRKTGVWIHSEKRNEK